MKYTIDTSRVNDEAQRMNAIANQIMSASDKLNSIMASDGLRTDSGKRIMKSLMSVKKELEQNSRKTGKYANTLSDIAKLYEKAENKASGNAEFKVKNKYTKAEKQLMKFGKGAASFAGGIVSSMVTAALGPIADAGKLGKDVFAHGDITDFVEDGTDLFKDVYGIGKDFVKGGKAKAVWADAFGLKPETSSFKEQVFGDYYKASKECEIDKIGISWATTILVSATSNYVEHGGFSRRMAEETAVETGLSIGKDIAVGAAATAIVGAIGVAGAPAIATAVAAAGVGFVIDKAGNYVAQKVTGDPKAEWMECVSDLICDKGEEIGGLISNRVKGIVSTVGSNTQIQWAAALA